MRRRLLALLFCLTALAAFAQFLERSTDVTVVAVTDVASATEAAAPQGAGDSDTRWTAGPRAIISVTESRWKSSVVHANLATAPSGNAFTETVIVGRRGRPAGNPSAHLRHVPLLI